MTAHYTIRYRCEHGPGRTALIVAGDAGAAYLFSGGALQGRLVGRDACARLATLLAHYGAWAPVPEVAAYSEEDLRTLAGAPPPRPSVVAAAH
ncbi:MAG TPA: hypothetical protein VFW96_07400 [Thermomicrobiales bacterium]|nr:hypothetical protein [Thermomicrobiales bacterium]